MNRSARHPLVLVSLASLLIATCSSTRQEQGGTRSASVSISSIQGRGHRSHLDSQRVEGVTGVVTAILATGRAPGFWIQDPVGDGDPATSDAIFVLTKGVEVTAATGDLVTVSGEVNEFGSEGSLTTTQITKPEVRVTSSGNKLPAPVAIGRGGRAVPHTVDDDGMRTFDPRRDAIDFWESLEAMRVVIADPTVVGASNSFGDVVVISGDGHSSIVRSIHGGVVLQKNNFNGERVVIDPRLVPRPATRNAGDRFQGPVTGIVEYGFGMFRIANTEPLPGVTGAAWTPEVTALSGDSEHVTIATYNVLNLSATNSDEKYRMVATTIVKNLRSPDVIALQEIQDDSGTADDGVVSTARTFQRLIESIVKEGGPAYGYRQIDPVNNQDGGQPGGNIRVGFLYNVARIEMIDRGSGDTTGAVSVEGRGMETSLTMSPGRIEPTAPCFAGSADDASAEPTRKSLAAELRFGSQKIFLIVNHLKSKRGDDSIFGANQPPKWSTETQRTCQAEIIGRFAAGILTRNPGAHVVVTGDMNEHEFRTPMLQLAATSGLTNLVDRVALPERYTFVFEGNSQILDHVFISPSLEEKGRAEIDVVHVNTDFADGTAASDHDPVVVRLKM